MTYEAFMTQAAQAIDETRDGKTIIDVTAELFSILEFIIPRTSEHVLTRAIAEYRNEKNPPPELFVA